MLVEFRVRVSTTCFSILRTFSPEKLRVRIRRNIQYKTKIKPSFEALKCRQGIVKRGGREEAELVQGQSCNVSGRSSDQENTLVRGREIVHSCF